MEVNHGSNMLPASANHSFTCGVLPDSDHKPVIESLQLLAACHWHSILMIFLPTIFLHLQTEVSRVCAALCTDDKTLVNHLILVEDINNGGASCYQALVPSFIVRCIVAVIS